MRVIDQELLADTDRVFVVGDLHGDLDTLQAALDVWDPARDVMVLIGDYGDRGSHSFEVIDRVNELLDEHPERVIALQGNHEDFSPEGEPYFSPCDLVDEAQAKWGSWNEYWRETLQPFIQRLYLAAIIPGETLFVHGGVSSRIHHRGNLESPEEAVELDVMYSDPTTAFLGEANNNVRQCGMLFGADVTDEICNRLDVQRIIRGHSHAPARFRPDVVHGGKVITVISSRVFASTSYVVVFDAAAPQQLKRLGLADGKLTDVPLESLAAPVGTNQEKPVVRAIQLDGDVKRAYDTIAHYCRTGNLDARFRLPTVENLELASEEGCEFFRLPIAELNGEAPMAGDQRSLIVEMHRQTRRIVGIFYAPQLTAAALRRVEE